MSDYPRKGLCAECGQVIYVQFSWQNKKEYATNIEKRAQGQKRWPEGSFHQCKNWKDIEVLNLETGKTDKIRTVETRPVEFKRAQVLTTQSAIKVSKIIVEYAASKVYERKKSDGDFGSETHRNSDELKLGVELDVEIYDNLQVENATKDYVALLKRNVKGELGLK